MAKRIFCGWLLCLFLWLCLSPPVLAESNEVVRQILVNIPAMTLTYYENGTAVKRYPIAVGRTLTQTPVGEYRIITKIENPIWYPKGRPPVPAGPHNPLGQRWIGYFQGYGIHGNNNPATIGTMASSGCIRLYNPDIEELYDKVKIGDPVKNIYELLQTEWDEQTKQTVLTVYPDLYKIVSDPAAHIQEIVAREGLNVLIPPETLARMAQVPITAPRRVPLGGVLVRMNGQVLDRVGAVEDGQIWLPLKPLAQIFGQMLDWKPVDNSIALNGTPIPEAKVWRDTACIPLAAAEALFGIQGWFEQPTGQILLIRQRVNIDGREVLREYWHRGAELWLPLVPLVEALGQAAQWDSETNTVWVGDTRFIRIVNGRTFVTPQEFAAAFNLLVNVNPLTGDINFHHL